MIYHKQTEEDDDAVPDLPTAEEQELDAFRLDQTNDNILNEDDGDLKNAE